MSTKITEVFTSHTYPKWIANNAIFSQLPSIRKVFPSIGLDNFEEKTLLDNSTDIANSARYLLRDIISLTSSRLKTLSCFIGKAKIGKARKIKIISAKAILSEFIFQVEKAFDACMIVGVNGKMTLSLPTDIIVDNIIVAKKGMGIFKFYERVSSTLIENKVLGLLTLATMPWFKTFSSVNVPGKEITVKFSSDGGDGIWDIATMSMRGVQSCQTWDQGRSATSLRLIGSMVDPFTGIIYLSGDKVINGHGSKMIRRCIVRYVHKRLNAEPFLLLEKMYPAFDRPSLTTFIQALSKRLPKFDIKYTGDMGERVQYDTRLADIYVPLSDEVKMLQPQYYPYCDSGTPFIINDNCAFSKNSSRIKELFKIKAPEFLQKAIQSPAFTQYNVKPYGKTALNIMSHLRRKQSAIKIDQKTKPPVIDLTTSELSNQLTSIIAEKSKDINPLEYLKSQEGEQTCVDFINNKFNIDPKSQFADFVSNNMINYLTTKFN